MDKNSEYNENSPSKRNMSLSEGSDRMEIVTEDDKKLCRLEK